MISRTDAGKRTAEMDARRQVIMNTYANARQAGDRKVWFVNGAELLGDTDLDLCSVDGVHPTDIGFLRMADGLEPLLRKILYGSRE